MMIPPLTPAEVREQVLGGLLQREKEHFWGRPSAKAGVEARASYERHLNMLAVATMVLGADRAELKDPKFLALSELLPTGAVGALFDEELYNRMSGQAVGRRLAPLQPDLLGEYFVLHRLKEVEPLGQHKELVALALSLAGDRAAAFIARAAVDFPDRFAELDGLDAGDDLGPAEALAYANSLLDVAAFLGHRGQAVAAERMASRLQKFASRRNETLIYYKASQATFGVDSVLYKTRDFDGASRRLTYIRETAERFDDSDLWRLAAQATVNLAFYLGEFDLDGEARELTWLNNTAIRLDDGEMQIWFFRASISRAKHLLDAGLFKQAWQVRRWMENLALSYPQEDELRGIAYAISVFEWPPEPAR